MPYTCASCGTTSAHNVDVGAHHDVLKFATAPELRCPQCKHAMQCDAGETVMTLLPTLPRPTAEPELVKSIGDPARARARGRRAGPRAPREPTGTRARRGSRAGALVGARCRCSRRCSRSCVAAGGYLAYQRVHRASCPAGLGAVTERSADGAAGVDRERRAGRGDLQRAPGKALSCVGVSSISARQDDAEDEAADAAFDAVANALAVRIADARVEAARCCRSTPRRATPSSPRSIAIRATRSARRDVREARHAVAQALRATGGGAVPAAPTGATGRSTHGADGKRYLAFAQVTIGATELARLVDGYTQPATRARRDRGRRCSRWSRWRYPQARARRGDRRARAAARSRSSGSPSSTSCSRSTAATSATRRRSPSSPSDEYAALVERGGTLRLKVQAADGAPREFATAIKPPRPELGAGVADRQAPARAGAAGSGINVWDSSAAAGAAVATIRRSDRAVTAHASALLSVETPQATAHHLAWTFASAVIFRSLAAIARRAPDRVSCALAEARALRPDIVAEGTHRPARSTLIGSSARCDLVT